MSNEPFRLQNEAPPHQPWRGEAPERTEQRMLISGLDCLPGQMDLFQTDGDTDSDDPKYMKGE